METGLSLLLFLGSVPDCLRHQAEDIWRQKDRDHSVYFYILDIPFIWVSVVESQILAQGTLYVHKYKS